MGAAPESHTERAWNLARSPESVIRLRATAPGNTLHGSGLLCSQMGWQVPAARVTLLPQERAAVGKPASAAEARFDNAQSKNDHFGEAVLIS
jgi:hypothetical protein